MSLIPVNTRVKIVDDVDKVNSLLIGREGIVIGYKWNRNREERNLPVVQLDSGQIVSGLSLWYKILKGEKQK